MGPCLAQPLAAMPCLTTFRPIYDSCVALDSAQNAVLACCAKARQARFLFSHLLCDAPYREPLIDRKYGSRCFKAVNPCTSQCTQFCSRIQHGFCSGVARHDIRELFIGVRCVAFIRTIPALPIPFL